MPAVDAASLQHYHIGWVILAVVLLVAVAAWIWWVLWHTSARRYKAPAPTVAPMEQRVRNRFVDAVDRDLAEFEAGHLDLRALHLRFAATVRDFVTERVGRDVHSWTASEIGSWDPTQKAGALLRDWEEPSFALSSQANAQRSAQGAREVITQW